MSDSPPRSVWVISDGRRGIENQALGLAEAMARGVPMQIYRLKADRAHLPLWLAGKSNWQKLTLIDPPDGVAARLKDPVEFPDLVIGCGRASLRYSRFAKAASGGRTRVIQVQDPKLSRKTREQAFDAIVPPAHDRLSGGNVVEMLGSPNRITPDVLKAATAGFQTELAAFPAPRVAVLVGGDSKKRRLTLADGRALMQAVDTLLAAGFSALITPSRRTPVTVRDMLAARYGPNPRVWMYDEQGANPYFAFLAGADSALVTEESTNMLTEAASAGLPVWRFPVTGSPGKFTRLYTALETRGHVRPWQGSAALWDVSPLDETKTVAQRLIERLGLMA